MFMYSNGPVCTRRARTVRVFGSGVRSETQLQTSPFSSGCMVSRNRTVSPSRSRICAAEYSLHSEGHEATSLVIGMPCRSRIWDWISSTARESKPRSLKGTSAISLSSVTASSVPALDRMISMRSSRVIIVSSSYVVPWSTAYDQRGVEAAVAAGEDECRPDGCLAARADDEIQLVFWYRVPNAHGRRDHPVAD